MRLEFGIVILVLSSSSVVLAEVNGAPGNVFSAPFPLSLIPPTPDGPSHICNQYPASALRKGAEGFAALSFIIDADGSVKDISIAESSGNSDLDKAAISCVTTWRYRAARLNGRPQAVRRSFSIAWSLHGVQRPPITGPAYEIAYGPAPQPGAKGSTPEDGSPHNCARLYPQDAIDAGVQGTTRLAFRRLSDGSTAEISVLRSSGNEQLDQAAIGCASQWKYAIVEGAPPFFNWTADIRWQLKSDQVTR